MTTSTSQPQSRVIAVTPDLIQLAGDGNAAIFLAQVLFWWRVAGRKKFYKFNSPCNHRLYRVGDSWMEELRLKRTMFSTARHRVATKVRITCLEEIQSAFAEGALLVYGTDENHLTWYIVNEAALQQRSPAVFARLFEGAAPIASIPAKSPRLPSPVQSTPSPNANSPAIPIAVSQSTPSVSVDVVSPHSPMQGSYIGIHTENTTQTAPETASKNRLPLTSEDIPLPTHQPAPTRGGGVSKSAENQKFTQLIFAGLQERGVQDDPARLIARRAVRAGLNTITTLEMFDAHLLDAARTNAVSPVGVAVSRMVKNSQMTPAPEWALARVRRRMQEQVWATRQACEVGELAENDESVAAISETKSVSEGFSVKTLWQQVLDDIKLQVTRATFEQRFKHTWLEQRGSGYVVQSHDSHTLEWLAHRLNSMVTKTLQRYAGVEIYVGFGG